MKQYPTEPKPFDFVPLEKEKKPERAKRVGHDQWQGNAFIGSLDCSLRVLTALHIGSGQFELANGQVVRGFATQNGQLVIPGSSLKGVFRSIAEAISASCVSKTSQPFELPSKEFAECDNPDRLCVCCRIFGATGAGGKGYLGRVRFTDAELTSGQPTTVRIPALFSPRPTARLYRDDRRLKGRKFYYHGRLSSGNEPLKALREGATFRFRADFENLNAAELHLLLTAMGVFGGLRPKIGGGKPACLGSVEVTLAGKTLRDPAQRFLTYEDAERVFTEEEWAAVKAANDLVRSEAVAKLRSMLAVPPRRNCPSSPY